MSRALARSRARFEATPRKLDDESLDRIARGDRGCLGDLLSGVGALVLVTIMILGALGKLAFSWAYLGVALWVGGFVIGTLSQARSGRERKAALEAGPLVLGVVMRDEPWLHRPGKQSGRAVVLFSTDAERRFDRSWLDAQATRIEHELSAPTDAPARIALRALLADRDSFGCHRVPADLGPDAEVWLASVILHPDRLEGGYLGAEEDREADAADLDYDAPKRRPAVTLFVEPTRDFVEQAPRVG